MVEINTHAIVKSAQSLISPQFIIISVFCFAIIKMQRRADITISRKAVIELRLYFRVKLKIFGLIAILTGRVKSYAPKICRHRAE